MRVLIHPGFHKTGTTTLQRTLDANRTALAGRLDVLLFKDIARAATLAQAFSVRPKPHKLAEFRAAFRESITPFARGNTPLLISCEWLAGILPGRKGVWSYDRAPRILRAVTREVRDTLGEDTDTTIWLSTRNSTDWMRSVYWQNLRSTRITEGFADFSQHLLATSDLEKTVTAIRASLDAKTRVLSTDLGECDAPLGLLQVALDVLGVSNDGIVPRLADNTQPDNGIRTLLQFNRSAMTEDDLAIAKRAYLDQVNADKATTVRRWRKLARTEPKPD